MCPKVKSNKLSLSEVPLDISGIWRWSLLYFSFVCTVGGKKQNKNIILFLVKDINIKSDFLKVTQRNFSRESPIDGEVNFLLRHCPRVTLIWSLVVTLLFLSHLCYDVHCISVSYLHWCSVPWSGDGNSKSTVCFSPMVGTFLQMKTETVILT